MAGRSDRLLRIAQGAAGYRTRWTLGASILAATVAAIFVDAIWLRTAPSPDMVQAKVELERALAALDSYRLPRIRWVASELDELARLTDRAGDALQRTRDPASQGTILNALRDNLRHLAQDMKERESVRIVDWHARVAKAEGDLRLLGEALARSHDGIEAAIRQETRVFDRLRAESWVSLHGSRPTARLLSCSPS